MTPLLIYPSNIEFGLIFAWSSDWFTLVPPARPLGPQDMRDALHFITSRWSAEGQCLKFSTDLTLKEWDYSDSALIYMYVHTASAQSESLPNK